MSIGEKIRDLRIAQDWSQQELADKLQVSRNTIFQWETGEVVPDIATLQQLGEIFSVNIETFIADLGIKDKPRGSSLYKRDRVKKRLKPFLPLALFIVGVLLVFTFFYNGYQKKVANQSQKITQLQKETDQVQQKLNQLLKNEALLLPKPSLKPNEIANLNFEINEVSKKLYIIEPYTRNKEKVDNLINRELQLEHRIGEANKNLLSYQLILGYFEKDFLDKDNQFNPDTPIKDIKISTDQLDEMKESIGSLEIGSVKEEFGKAIQVLEEQNE